MPRVRKLANGTVELRLSNLEANALIALTESNNYKIETRLLRDTRENINSSLKSEACSHHSSLKQALSWVQRNILQ